MILRTQAPFCLQEDACVFLFVQICVIKRFCRKVEEKPGFRGLEKGKTIFFSVKWEKYG